MALNVCITNSKDNLSRQQLIIWINDKLKCELKKIEHLCTGAVYCQLIDMLFPDQIPLKRVKFCTNRELDFINNLKLLQNSFVKLQIDKKIPIEILVKGRFQANFEFLQWFYKFFLANYKQLYYDAESARGGQIIAMQTPPKTNKNQSKKNNCF